MTDSPPSPPRGRPTSRRSARTARSSPPGTCPGRGWCVLDRNWRCDLGEIDLVLRDGTDAGGLRGEDPQLQHGLRHAPRGGDRAQGGPACAAWRPGGCASTRSPVVIAGALPARFARLERSRPDEGAEPLGPGHRCEAVALRLAGVGDRSHHQRARGWCGSDAAGRGAAGAQVRDRFGRPGADAGGRLRARPGEPDPRGARRAAGAARPR